MCEVEAIKYEIGDFKNQKLTKNTLFDRSCQKENKLIITLGQNRAALNTKPVYIKEGPAGKLIIPMFIEIKVIRSVESDKFRQTMVPAGVIWPNLYPKKLKNFIFSIFENLYYFKNNAIFGCKSFLFTSTYRFFI